MKSKTLSKPEFLKRIQMIGKVTQRLNEMGVALKEGDDSKVMAEMFRALDRKVSYVFIVVKLKDGIRRRSYELQDLDLRITVPPNPPLIGI